MPAALDVAELGERVVIVATHPDDEVLVAGGTMHVLRSLGVAVRVVLLTAGDGYLRAARRLGRFSPDASTYRRLGETRFHESVEAAGRLGVASDDVVCLGYPDGRLAAMWSADRDTSPAMPGRSGTAIVPYDWAYRSGAPCTGNELVADLTSLFRTFQPTAVIHPDARDAHADHAASASFAREALDASGFAGTRLTALVHFGHYPYPWAYRPSDSIRPPRALRGPETDWRTVELDDDALAAKEAALRAFASQNAIPDLRYFMRAFLRSNELFAVARD